ncbi:cell division protein ZapA [Clostridium sediminicola]|uniref:cell division protein ZapA n=1 Tax=Clostridium sediminicola TaxID=3114879 RepID=UPI0031F23C79
MNVVTVKINGIEYNLKGEEKSEYLHTVASFVDKKIREIMGFNNMLSTTEAAVLTAVNVTDEMFKVEKSNDLLKNEISDSRTSYKELEKKFEDLKKYNQSLENYNAELQLKLDSNAASQLIKQGEEENKQLTEQINMIKRDMNDTINEKDKLKDENKDLKFQLQSSKYKIMDLQNKLIEHQIDLAKLKRKENPLINFNEAK